MNENEDENLFNITEWLEIKPLVSNAYSIV
jgi:hypothetical protein